MGVDEGQKAEEQSKFLAQLRATLNVLPGYTWYGNSSGGLLFVNNRQADFLGVPKDHPLRFGIDIGAQWDAWIPFLHPDEQEEGRRYWSNCLRTSKGDEHNHRLRNAEGDYRWFRTRTEPLRASDGTVLLWIGVSLDIQELKRADEGLRESEYKLRQIFETVPALLWSLAPDGEPNQFNQRMLDYFGRPFEDFKHGAWGAFLHPEDLPKAKEDFSRDIQNGASHRAEFRLRGADGEFRWHQSRCEPLRDQQGQIIQWYGLTIDIDERKRAEQALRESEAKIRRLVDANIIGIFIWDFDGRILEANQAFLDIVAYDHEDLRAGHMRWTELTPPEWRDRDTRLIQEQLENGSLQPFEKEYFRKDGGRVPVLIGVATFEEGGNQGVAFVIDLTERKRAERALQESERNARSAIDGIDGLVAILAPNGELDTANRRLIEYFDQPPEWINNWGTNGAVHPEDLPRALENFRRAMASGNAFQNELRLRRFDGEYRWFDTRNVPIRDDSGRIVRWYVLLMDIEDRKRALARLDQMQVDFTHMNRVSLMGELVASLSHEITQPIASARIYARAAQNFLGMPSPDLGEVREALARVVAEVGRAGDIIDRIRDQVRKAPPRKERFDLNEAIEEVIVLGRNAIIKNRVWVQTRLAEGLCPVHGDRVQLQQVILNLLLNAIEAMGGVEAAPRELLISTKQDHTGVLVAVQDSGPGIPPEHLERVFDSFYTTKPSGTGMGLSICRSIVGAHGGRLWAEANQPHGTIVQFTLPAV
ncbi:PAS domain-containing protein [Bradyrhizobium erythrophlei]|nr:PAS domain-containing protein [Bradyrhizobium erythrophlei]